MFEFGFVEFDSQLMTIKNLRAGSLQRLKKNKNYLIFKIEVKSVPSIERGDGKALFKKLQFKIQFSFKFKFI